MTDTQHQEERRRSERRKLPRYPGGHVNKSVKNSGKKRSKKRKIIFKNKLHVRQSTCMTSVKPFKSKNRDKIDLDAPNLNL